MIEASCHCGAVHLTIRSIPTEITDCNCSICRRYGVLWAYYGRDEVEITPPGGATEIYRWGARRLEFHRCKDCGCVTHWQPTDPARDCLGVNTRLMAPEAVAGVRIRMLDGAVTMTYRDDETR